MIAQSDDQFVGPEVLEVPRRPIPLIQPLAERVYIVRQARRTTPTPLFREMLQAWKQNRIKRPPKQLRFETIQISPVWTYAELEYIDQQCGALGIDYTTWFSEHLVPGWLALPENQEILRQYGAVGGAPPGAHFETGERPTPASSQPLSQPTHPNETAPRPKGRRARKDKRQ